MTPEFISWVSLIALLALIVSLIGYHWAQRTLRDQQWRWITRTTYYLLIISIRDAKGEEIERLRESLTKRFASLGKDAPRSQEVFNEMTKVFDEIIVESITRLEERRDQ